MQPLIQSLFLLTVKGKRYACSLQSEMLVP